MRKNLAIKEEHILTKKPLVNNAQIKTIVMGVKTAELKLNGCTHWSFLTVPYFNGFVKVKVCSKDTFNWIMRHHTFQDKVSILDS